MLDTHQLNIFLAAAELENFSEAARQLNLSQPSVSAQIRSLERLLGTQLFHRSGRHISLTEAGQILQPLAELGNEPGSLPDGVYPGTVV